MAVCGSRQLFACSYGGRVLWWQPRGACNMQVAHVSCLAVNTRLDLKIEDEDED